MGQGMLDIDIEKPTLLLVDDEPVNLRVLKQLLANDYQLIFARNGEEALKLAPSRQPNLILLDVMMPKRDGYDVCQEVRSNPDYDNLRIVMLTARGREIERQKGLSLGADDYITKPFAIQDVVEKVKQLLGEG